MTAVHNTEVHKLTMFCSIERLPLMYICIDPQLIPKTGRGHTLIRSKGTKQKILKTMKLSWYRNVLNVYNDNRSKTQIYNTARSRLQHQFIIIIFNYDVIVICYFTKRANLIVNLPKVQVKLLLCQNRKSNLHMYTHHVQHITFNMHLSW